MDLVEAAKGRLNPDEQFVHSWTGLSDGLNRDTRNPCPASVSITNSAVVVAWAKVGFRAKTQSIRFGADEIIDVVESHEALPGLVGALERKNSTHALARAMGSSNTRPTLTICTRTGDFALFFKPKQLGDLRAAYVAISDLRRS